MRDPDAKDKPGVDRRRLLIGGALAGVAGTAAADVSRHDGMLGAEPQTFSGAMPWRGGAADAPPMADVGTNYTYFTSAEAAWIEAASDRLIPKDDTGPSATEAGVPIFIDRQLAGPYGHGDHFYMGGPWAKGTPEQGYQSRFAPGELYRHAIPAIEDYARKTYGKGLRDLGTADQDALLKALEAGKADLGGGVDGKAFFALFLQNVKEGYLSDPVYGGNRDMAAWKMIGFPGAHYDYREWVPRHNQRVPYPPVSLKGRPGWSKA
jgi:gluconate 2-dehydrogenase gamma chain